MFGDYVSIVMSDKVKEMDIESTGAHFGQRICCRTPTPPSIYVSDECTAGRAVDGA
jgi:hypothetical protein